MDGYEDKKDEEDEEEVVVYKKGVSENEGNEVDILDSVEQNSRSANNVVNSESK